MGPKSKGKSTNVQEAESVVLPALAELLLRDLAARPANSVLWGGRVAGVSTDLGRSSDAVQRLLE